MYHMDMDGLMLNEVKVEYKPKYSNIFSINVLYNTVAKISINSKTTEELRNYFHFGRYYFHSKTKKVPIYFVFSSLIRIFAAI